MGMANDVAYQAYGPFDVRRQLTPISDVFPSDVYDNQDLYGVNNGE